MKLLIYAQDRGGGNYLSPVIKMLVKTYKSSELLILVHPLSQNIFIKNGISHISLEKSIVLPPVDENNWKSFLEAQNITHVFCTTSSPYLDISNGNLIAVSKKLEIPVMAVFDHWKGFDRFFYQGKPIFVPDYTCCIDEYSRQKMAEIGIPMDKVFAVGHPHLEKIIQRSREQDKPIRKIRVLLVSQPNTANQSFKGIFFLCRGEKRLIDEIALRLSQVFAKQGLKGEIRYRPHPKEQSIEALPENVKMDEGQEWDEALSENNIFLGLDSMAMVEAYLSGKYCISFALPEFEGLSDNLIPIAFPSIIDTLSDLPSAIEDAIRTTTKNTGTENKFLSIFEDSTHRILTLVDQFFHCELN